MKVYIYRELLDERTQRLYQDAYASNLHNLRHHFLWFSDLLALLSQFETREPDEADYFFVPVYTILFEFLRKDVGELIARCAHLDRGNHLLFVSGDYGHRARSPRETSAPTRVYPRPYDWLDSRFVLIALESTSQLHPRDIAIFPYQPARDDGGSLAAFNRRSRLRLSGFDLASVRAGQDALVYSFCGALRYPDLPPDHVRGDHGIVRLAGAGRGWFIGSADDARKSFAPQLAGYEAIISRSVFTLCPAGYGRWTFRWIEALLNGSIPIMISDGYVLPFSETVDWRRFVIEFPERDIARLDAFVRSISLDVAYQKQSSIIKSQRLFTRESCRRLLLGRLMSGVATASEAAPEHRESVA